MSAAAQLTGVFPPSFAASTLDGLNGFVLNGIDANDESGYSVSSAGDVNGDGIDDIIIGAPQADPGFTSQGESYVVFGGAGVGSGASIDLSALDGSNGYVLTGVSGTGFSGIAVSSAGDVNGDGVDDIIIGAYLAGVADAGQSYVVFGGADADADNRETGDILLSSLDGTNGFVINGIDANDRNGFSVSSAGDVNSDGFDDIIIGANAADPNGNNDAGESYVVFGGPGVGSSGQIELSFLDGTNGFVINGIDSNDRSGLSVSCAGDVNGDGADDVIIGAYGADQNGNDLAGESYVVFGGAGVGSSGSIDLSGLNGANGFVLNGIDGSDDSGKSVSSAGDINGDGIDDIIIGAPRAEYGYGESFVVFGGAGVGQSGSVDLSSLNGSNGFVLGSTDLIARSGYSVSAAGDVNGDGLDDLLVGATYAGPVFGGGGYVVFGGAGIGQSGSIAMSALSGSDGFLVYGSTSSRAGRSVSSAGDVNGDGLDDIIIGAYFANSNGNSRAGKSYVVFGRTDQVWNRDDGGSFEAPGNWASGSAPQAGIVVVKPMLGGTVALSQPAGPSLESLFIGSEQGITTLDIGPTSTLSVVTPFVVPASAAITGEGSLGVESGLTNRGYFAFDGMLAGDLTNETLVDIDGRREPGGVAGFESTGTVLNLDGAELRLQEGGVEIIAGSIENGGEITVAFADATLGGPVENSGLSPFAAGFEVVGVGGDSVSSAGDVNCDGIDDIIINGLQGPYVVFGGRETASLTTLDPTVLNGSDGFALVGLDMDALSGISVSSAGDVNGDGASDLIVGAPQADLNGSIDAGKSYVVFGTASIGQTGSVDVSSLNGSDGFVINGTDAGDKSGYSVSSAGDVNGDGVGDIVIGAPGDLQSDFGKSYVVFGGASVGQTGSVDLSTLNGSDGFVINDIIEDNNLGRRVSSAGDLNNDGVDDVVIAGNVAYVVFGDAGVGQAGSIDLALLDGTDGVSIFGGFSTAVASAGDVNGDGIDDLILGSPYATGSFGASNAGRSTVLFGGAVIGQKGIIDLSDGATWEGTSLLGDQAFEQSGWAVSSAGDINGDGIGDLAIGARAFSPDFGTPGRTYVVFGSADMCCAAPRQLDGSNGFIVNGEIGSTASGRAVSSAGDLNNDGVDDLIILANAYASVVFGRGFDAFPETIDHEDLSLLMTQGTLPGRVSITDGSEILFSDDLSNPGTIMLSADSQISIAGSFSGNGVFGPSGPGSAGPVSAMDAVLPGVTSLGLGTGGNTQTAGLMRFDGDLQLAPTSRLLFDLAGDGPGKGHDQIAVAGALGAAGTAEISLVDGFMPQPGDSFQLLTFGSVTGSLSIVLDPQLVALDADTSGLLIDGTITIPSACIVDLNADGLLDLSDITLFVAAFTAMDPIADLDNSGLLDLSDINAFVSGFLIGCP